MLLSLVLASMIPEPETRPTVVVVVGSPGTDEFGSGFRIWAERWQAAAERGDAKVVRIGTSQTDKVSDRERLQQAIAAAANESGGPLWIVLLGHGTFDGREAKFNLRGPDVSAAELSDWLKPVKRTVAVINCASSSAPFINRISGERRIVVSATKSGSEHNYARFGEYLSQVIANPEADLDKDGQTSLLEAWLVASRRTQDFYKDEGRLATEHSLLDDNGDARGTRYDSFRGIRAQRQSSSGALDGLRAHQLHLVRGSLERSMPAELLARRDRIELQVLQLREQRSDFTEDAYYQELERLLVELALVYDEAEQAARGESAGGADSTE